MQIETCDFGLRELEPKVEQANRHGGADGGYRRSCC